MQHPAQRTYNQVLLEPQGVEEIEGETMVTFCSLSFLALAPLLSFCYEVIYLFAGVYARVYAQYLLYFVHCLLEDRIVTIQCQ